MSFLRQIFRGLGEQSPFLSAVYRTVRDEWRFLRQRPVRTSEGFWFSGDRSMETGAFETEETMVITDLLQCSDTFVDIGANIGYYTCLASGKGKNVLAVEPFPGNLRRLYRNIEKNRSKNIEVWPVGLSSSPDCLTLWGGGTGASLIRGWSGVSGSWKQTIPVNTLDNILGKRFSGKRLLIKIDVEGAEFAALQGAEATLQMIPRPVWVVEIVLSAHHPETNPNFYKTFEIFWQNGYHALTADKKRKPVTRLDIERCLELGSCDNYNWLFIHSDENRQ